jgi:hypothetical protein
MKITESSRVAFACFVGAFIGALIALELNHYFWWVGVLAGGGIGYIAYRFESVLTVARKVLVEMTKERHVNLERTVFFISCVGLSTVALGCVFFTLGLFASISASALKFELFPIAPLCAGFGSFIGFFALICSFDEKEEMFDFFKKVIWYTNPICAPVYIVYFVIKGLGWFVEHIPMGVTLGIYFGKRVFLLIHSEIRLLCMTDAMIGAMTGYFAGSALVGGIVGALVGVLNYELVSVRWLKLVPHQ